MPQRAAYCALKTRSNLCNETSPAPKRSIGAKGVKKRGESKVRRGDLRAGACGHGAPHTSRAQCRARRDCCG